MIFWKRHDTNFLNRVCKFYDSCCVVSTFVTKITVKISSKVVSAVALTEGWLFEPSLLNGHEYRVKPSPVMVTFSYE